MPASWISKYNFRTNKYLKEVKGPIYIFHGTEDRKVPYYLGEKLIGTNPSIKFYRVEGATHNEMQDMPFFQEKMQEILA